MMSFTSPVLAISPNARYTLLTTTSIYGIRRACAVFPFCHPRMVGGHGCTEYPVSGIRSQHTIVRLRRPARACYDASGTVFGRQCHHRSRRRLIGRKSARRRHCHARPYFGSEPGA